MTPTTRCAAISYYRGVWDPSTHVPELADEQAATLLPTPRPTLYLHGADDGCMLLSSVGAPLDFLADGSEYDVVEGTGHFLHLEKPVEVNAPRPRLPEHLMGCREASGT